MKTPDEIMLKNGLRVEWLKKYEPDTYDNIRKSMDDFADQYAEWKLKKFSERQTTTEVSDNHESKALNIAVVSNLSCATFESDSSISSATRCKNCGREEWEHPTAT